MTVCRSNQHCIYTSLTTALQCTPHYTARTTPALFVTKFHAIIETCSTCTCTAGLQDWCSVQASGALPAAGLTHRNKNVVYLEFMVQNYQSWYFCWSDMLLVRYCTVYREHSTIYSLECSVGDHIDYVIGASSAPAKF